MHYEKHEETKSKLFIKLLGSLILKIIHIGLIILAIIWLVYLWHVWNYPPSQELADAQTVIGSYRVQSLAKLDFWLMEHSITRPLGQYFLGLLMDLQRAGGGNTSYYLGEVSASGWKSYFPVAFLLKETLAFIILSVLALIIAVKNAFKAKEKSVRAIANWLQNNFVLTSSLVFVIFYWTYSINSALNIGIRHVLPTFPFIYLLVAYELRNWIYGPSDKKPDSVGGWLSWIYQSFIKPIPKIAVITLLMVWMIASVLSAYPYYLSYYNEVVGIQNGYKFIDDSNYDWGQDLKRLKVWINDNLSPGQKIYLDYFGGGSPSYYLDDEYISWWSAKGTPPAGSYYAVSATILAGAEGRPVGDTIIKPEDSYPWLKGQEPIARGGISILIYKIPQTTAR